MGKRDRDEMRGRQVTRERDCMRERERDAGDEREREAGDERQRGTREERWGLEEGGGER